MTPPAFEGYWSQVWPPRSLEGLALLEEKTVAGKALDVASLHPLTQLAGLCATYFLRWAANTQNILFPN